MVRHHGLSPNETGSDPPQISLAYLPPTPVQTWKALVGAVVLLLILTVLLPFSAKQLPLVVGFIPALDAVAARWLTVITMFTLLRDETVRYEVAVRTELAADLPKVVGDRAQLQQAAMNLVVNSIEAMKDVDGVREIVIQSRKSDNDRIIVSFTDTGLGLSPQLKEQIFEPFFTTKTRGTGMGLRIGRSIIESHGGRLWAESVAG